MKWSESYTVNIHDLDQNGNMRPSAVLRCMQSVPEIAGCDAVTAAVVGIPTLMIGVNKRITDTGAETRCISGIKVDDSIQSDRFNNLTGAYFCSVGNETGLAVIQHINP